MLVLPNPTGGLRVVLANLDDTTVMFEPEPGLTVTQIKTHGDI